MEMGLSPVVKTQLSVPTHGNAASLQNPADSRAPYFPPYVEWFFLLFLPPLPGLFLCTQFYYHLSYIKRFSGACGVYTRN